MTLPPDTRLSRSVKRLREALAGMPAAELPLVLGWDEAAQPVVEDLASMPHLLVGGGRPDELPQMLHALIASMLLQSTPATCRLLLVDPTGLEFGIYEDIPHLLSPVATTPDDGMRLLRWLADEMEARYSRLARAGVRNISGYLRKGGGDDSSEMPHIITFISQLDDLRMQSESGFDHALMRLASKSRACGIHLVVGASHAENISSLIRANMPTRLLLATDSKHVARAVLEDLPSPLPQTGEFVFAKAGRTYPTRKAAAVPVSDLLGLADYWRTTGTPSYLPPSAFEPPSGDEPTPPDGDGLYARAIALVGAHSKASTSWLQRELRVGYNTAARLIGRMEEDGYVSAPEARGRRKVLAVPGDYDIEIADEPLEFGSKRAGSQVYFRERDFWEQPARRGNIDKNYTVEEILGFIDNSTPVDGQERAAFASALRQGVDQRFPLSRVVEQRTVSLPTEAPEIYQGLRGPENPPAFVKRVYGPWLGHGLTKAHIRNLDPKLYTAIDNWLKKPGCEWPDDVDLPTLKEQNDRMVAALTAGSPDTKVLKDARRIQGAITRRVAARANNE